MSVFGKPLSASAPILSGVGAACWRCFIAGLLFALPTSAQEQTAEGTAGAETAIEAPATAAEGTAESAAEAEAADSLVEGQYSVEDLEDLDEPLEPELPAGVEEIKITGERPIGTPEDAPISTVGFDADVILKEGIKDIRDLSNFTPSLEVKSAFAASNPTIFIRGVGLDDFNANAASAVAIYQDGVYMQSPAGQLFQLFDVENVDVLRGPQGSLYRSASAGAILVHSRKPTDEFETYATVTVGNYRHVEIVSAISGPIVPDLVSGRFSGTWGVREGTTKNRCSYLAPDEWPCDKTLFNESVVQVGIGERTNDIDAYALRSQLLYKPRVLDLEWLLNAHGGQNFSRAFQYQHRGVAWYPVDPTDPDIRIPQPLEPPKRDESRYVDEDGDPFAGDYNTDGPESLDLWGTNLKGIWRFGDAYELESLTAYEWHDRYILENTDANPDLMLEIEYADTAWQFSQELKLSGAWTPSEYGDGTWILGAFYLQEDLEVENFFDVRWGIDLAQAYSQKTRNFAAYAQSEYKLQPGCTSVSCDFTLTTGLRYNLEYKEFDIFVCGGVNCVESLSGVADEVWDGFSGEASLAWHFFEDNNVYLKYSRGWKGGHFNGGALTPWDVVAGVDPEIVDSYEAGLRSNWLDGQLMLNATGFYYDYQDLQVFLLEQTPSGFPIAKLENATDAVVYGIELDMAAAPSLLPGLTLTYNFSWVESDYTEFVVDLPFMYLPPRTPTGRPPPIRYTREFDYSGNPLIASPRLSMTGSVDYQIPIPAQLGRPGLGFIIPRFSFSWKDDVFFDAGSGRGAMLNFPKGTFGQENFWVLNASLGWRSEDERFEVVGWAHNFLDNHYKTQSFDISRGFSLILDAYADPRTYGVTVTISY
jgi:iron complex outermembrane receptor protein